MPATKRPDVPEAFTELLLKAKERSGLSYEQIADGVAQLTDWEILAGRDWVWRFVMARSAPMSEPLFASAVLRTLGVPLLDALEALGVDVSEGRILEAQRGSNVLRITEAQIQANGMPWVRHIISTWLKGVS